MKTLKDYKLLFRRYWGYGEQDTPICWGCYRKPAVDIHHLISKKMGGVKNNRLNRIDNLFILHKSKKWIDILENINSIVKNGV